MDRDAHREQQKWKSGSRLWMESESLPVRLLPGYSGWDRRETGLH